MARSFKAPKPFADVLRGLREVVRITLDKPIETTFSPQDVPPAPKTEDKPSEEAPLSKFGEGNSLILAHEYIEEVRSFLGQHSILDTCSVPCYYNNDSCNLNIYTLPRLSKTADTTPIVKPIVTLVVTYGEEQMAIAEYNAKEDNFIEVAMRDIDKLLPKQYRDPDEISMKARNSFVQRFPEFDFESSTFQPPIFQPPTDPIFLDENEKSIKGEI